MPSKNRPLTPEEAPDTARVYERARPEAEAGMGRLDKEKTALHKRADTSLDASPNKHTSRQLNSHDVVNTAGGPPAEPGRTPRKSRHQLADPKKKAHNQKSKRD